MVVGLVCSIRHPKSVGGEVCHAHVTRIPHFLTLKTTSHVEQRKKKILKLNRKALHVWSEMSRTREGERTDQNDLLVAILVCMLYGMFRAAGHNTQIAAILDSSFFSYPV